MKNLLATKWKKFRSMLIFITLLVVLGISVDTAVKPKNNGLPKNPNKDMVFDENNLKEIYLAGGCFWGLEAYMARVYGVANVVSGYANGNTANPTYMDVSHNNSGHAETVLVQFDPGVVSLADILRAYFGAIDPTLTNRQGNDVGIQYRTGIYFVDPQDIKIIQEVFAEEQKKYSKPLVVEVAQLKNFYKAEEMHQNYLEKNPNGYCHIDLNSVPKPEKKVQVTPNRYVQPSDAVLREKLTPLQYAVTREKMTDQPFKNEYNDNKRAGIYVDIITGEPLFTSLTKYDSGSGWPSFTEPISPNAVTTTPDLSHNMVRTEVRSHAGDNHLGHLFDDGPQDRGGNHYCINGSALRFIAFEDMEKEGYAAFKVLFI